MSSKSEHRETGQRSSSNDRRPFKSHRLKSFSTNGSSKHRHGFSSTFPPLLPLLLFEGTPTPQPSPKTSLSLCSPGDGGFFLALDVGTHNERASGNSAGFIRSLHAALTLFSTGGQSGHSLLNNLFDWLQNSRLIKRRLPLIRLSDDWSHDRRCLQESPLRLVASRFATRHRRLAAIGARGVRTESWRLFG